MLKMIKRNVPVTKVRCVVYNEETKSVYEEEHTIHGKLNERQVRKYFSLNDVKIADILEIKYTTIKYQMPLGQFLLQATEVKD